MNRLLSDLRIISQLVKALALNKLIMPYTKQLPFISAKTVRSFGV